MWPIVVLLLGCADPLMEGFIGPFDGRTAVPLNTPLVLSLPDHGLPPEAEIPQDLLRVVDLDAGGFVEGSLYQLDERFIFEATDGWRAHTHYVWSVSDVLPAARQPELQVSEAVAGEGTFSTASEPALVSAIYRGQELCLLFSEPLPSPAARTRVMLDGEEIELELTATEADTYPALQELFVLPIVYCAPQPASVIGAPLRVWVGDGSPVQVEVHEADLSSTIGDLFHADNL